jgi:outer membrane protein assembly factor BamB
MGEVRPFHRAPSAAIVALVAVAVLLGTPHCQSPTEITLDLSTDVPCGELTGVSITVGPSSEVETMAPETTTQACSSSGTIGSLVVVPGGTKNESVDIKVVGGVNRDPTSCAAPNYGSGCIVARRSLQFIPHTPLTLDIPLAEACNGVICPANETCVQGACTSSVVPDPTSCTVSAACGQSVLQPVDTPPLPPSPLVCGNTAGLQPAAQWPMLGYCPTHAGRGPNVGAKTNHVRWTATLGAGVTGGVSIAADGTVYVGAADGKLYAVSPTGSIKWAAAVGASSFTSAVPAIAQNGSVYIGNEDENLYAVSNSGAVLWEYRVGGKLFTSANVGGDGTIYIGGANEDEAMFALANNGALRWKFVAGNDVDSSPAIGFDGTVYVGSENANMYALGANGAEKWAFDDKEEGAQTPVIGLDGTIFFNGKSSICGIDPQGKLVWVTPTSDQASIPAIGWDGTVYAGSADGGFYAFDGVHGQIKWHLTSLGDFDWGTQPTIGADGTLYIGTTSGAFYALTPSGSILWKLTTGGAIHGPAAIATDGTVYFGADDDKLYAVGP